MLELNPDKQTLSVLMPLLKDREKVSGSEPRDGGEDLDFRAVLSRAVESLAGDEDTREKVKNALCWLLAEQTPTTRRWNWRNRCG